MRMYVRRMRAAVIATCAGFALTGTALAVDTPETEPNDTKATANAITAMAPGDTISGVTTGTSTTTPGDASADYFDITTTAAPEPGWYRYRLVLTSTIAGHTVTLRGLTQTTGTANIGTDATLQTGSTATAPPRYVQWYANEQASRVIYRVTGTASTTAAYTATLERTLITPVDIGTLTAGTIAISSIGTTTTDTDLHLFDGSRNAIPDGNNDDESVAGGGAGTTLQSRLQRSLADGVYFVGISNYDTSTNQTSPPDDDFRTGALHDHPNVLSNNSTTTALNLNFTVSNGSQTLNATQTKAAAFDVALVKFTVGGIPGPSVSGCTASPSSLEAGNPTTLSATVTPGGSPTITSVTANLADFGLGVVNLTDPDMNGTYEYVLNVPSGQAVSAYNIAVVATDANNNTGGCAIGLAVIPPPAANDTCGTATVIGAVPYTDSVLASTAQNDGDVSCNATANTELRFGAWYSYTTGADPGVLTIGETGPNDVVMAVYTGDCNGLSEIACIDVETGTPVAASANTTYYINIGMWSATTVPTGAYQITLNFAASMGACCASNGSCSLTTQSGCSGTFQGVDTSCFTFGNLNSGGGTFESIRATGTILAVASNCDDCGETLNLPFSFGFFSGVYNSVWVCSNGFIQFGGANNATFTNAPIPTAGIPNNFIAPFWDDLNTGTGAGDIFFRVDGTAGSRRVIISWENVNQFTLSDDNNFQVVLNEATQDFEFRYGAISPEATAGDYTVGYENAAGSAGASVNGADLGSGNVAYTVATSSPCPQTANGACCQGSTCVISSNAACTGFASAYAGDNTVCNVFGTNNLMPCCLADFNHVGGIGVQDIFDFLASYFNSEGIADINGGGLGVQDIFDFLFVYFNAGC